MKKLLLLFVLLILACLSDFDIFGNAINSTIAMSVIIPNISISVNPFFIHPPLLFYILVYIFLVFFSST